MCGGHRLKKNLGSFWAIPGHIIEVDGKYGHITVACNNSMLNIEEVEFKGKRQKPAEIFKSIRSRFINIPNKI